MKEKRILFTPFRSRRTNEIIAHGEIRKDGSYKKYTAKVLAPVTELNKFHMGTITYKEQGLPEIHDVELLKNIRFASSVDFRKNSFYRKFLTDPNIIIHVSAQTGTFTIGKGGVVSIHNNEYVYDHIQLITQVSLADIIEFDTKSMSSKFGWLSDAGQKKVLNDIEYDVQTAISHFGVSTDVVTTKVTKL